MKQPQTQLRATLLQALREAGKIMRKNFGKARIRYKGRANLVTQVDNACETLILKTILKKFPKHDYVTEERPARRSGAQYTWVIDPVDGTTNYAHAYPTASVSIGLLRGHRPCMGGVYDPFRDELFFAEEGRGARLNSRVIHVSKIARLRESLLSTGFAYDRAQRSRFYLEFYRRFMERSHDVRRCGSAALDLAWVACGRTDGFWEFNLNPWDVTAGLLLVQEAGGKVSDFSGRPWQDPARFGMETLATNGLVHREALKILSAPAPWRMPQASTRLNIG